jgi:hypothetical protein
MKTTNKHNPKWIRCDDELESAVEDEQIILQRALPGTKVSFSAALRSLALKGARVGQRGAATR